MGVTVTFIAILELMKEGLLEIVQAEPYAPIHVRPASGSRHLKVVNDDAGAVDLESSVEADAENAAALAQPAQPDENDLDEVDIDAEIAALPDEVEQTQSVTDDSVTVAPEGDETTGQGQ